MVQLHAAVTKLGEVYFQWFILLRSASLELAKNVLSADIGSGGVQHHLMCVPHFARPSYTFDDVPYFGEKGQSNHRCSLNFLSLPIIIVDVLVEIKWLRFRILSSDGCRCSHA